MNDKDFLSYFDQLVHPEEAQIEASGEKIITTLKTVEHNKSSKKKEFKSSFGKMVSEDLDYTVKRLLKGTSSDDIKTKIAFASVLAGVVQEFDNIQPEKYLEAVEKALDESLTLTKGEKAHSQIAKALSIFSILSNDSIDRLPNSQDVFTKIYEKMADLIKEKNSISHLGNLVIEKSFETTNDDDSKKKKLSALQKTFKSHVKSLLSNFDINIFALASFTALKQKELGEEGKNYVNDTIESVLRDTKLVNKIVSDACNLYPENTIVMKYLAEYILTFLTTSERDEVLTKIAGSIKSEDDVEKSNHQKSVFYVLELVRRIFKSNKMNAKVFAKLQEHSLFKLWIKSLRVKNKIICQKAKKTEKSLSKKVLDLVKASSSTPYQFLLSIKQDRSYPFDLKNPLAIVLYQALSVEEESSYVDHLINSFKNEKTSYQFYLDELFVLLQIKLNSLNEKNVLKIAEFYLETSISFEFNGIVEESEDVNPEDLKEGITKGVREESQIKLFSLVQVLLKSHSEGFKDKKSALWLGLSQNGQLWPHRIAKLVQKKFKSINHPASKIVAETINYIDTIYKTISPFTTKNKEIQLKDKERVKKTLAMILLISCSLIHILSLDDIAESIQELTLCSKDLLENHLDAEVEDNMSKKKKLNSSKGKKAKDEPSPHNVLIDLMISFMTRCSAFLREAIKRTFTQFVEDIDDMSLSNLIGVITRPEEEYIADMAEGDGELGSEIEDEGEDDEN